MVPIARMSNPSPHFPWVMAPTEEHTKDGILDDATSVFPATFTCNTGQPATQDEHSANTTSNSALESIQSRSRSRRKQDPSCRKDRKKASRSTMPRPAPKPATGPKYTATGLVKTGLRGEYVHKCYVRGCINHVSGSKTFSREEHLKRHEKEKHNVDLVVCHPCNFGFPDLASYQAHRKASHPPVIVYVPDEGSSASQQPPTGGAPGSSGSSSNSQSPPGYTSSAQHQSHAFQGYAGQGTGYSGSYYHNNALGPQSIYGVYGPSQYGDLSTFDQQNDLYMMQPYPALVDDFIGQ